MLGTSELAFARRPLCAHSSSDEIEDKESFDAPGIVNAVQRGGSISITQLKHIFIDKGFQFVLYPSTQRQHMKNPRVCLAG